MIKQVPMVPISIGELIDKITILRIKEKNIKSLSSLQNVKTELKMLESVLDSSLPSGCAIDELMDLLLQVNQKLWIIEDDLRQKERENVFDHEFVELARSVYFTNDERARIKREINARLGSHLVEEKSYSPY